MTELAEIVKRKLSAVNRDLKILEGIGAVELEKSGKKVKPTIDKKILIVPLISVEPQTIEEYEKGVKTH